MKIVSVLFLLIFFFGCEVTPSLEIKHLTGKTMGTTYNVKIVVPHEYNEKILQERIDERLVAVNQAMSTYIKDSEISIFNQSLKNQKQKISKDFLHVLSHSLSVSEKTNGVFDPTIGPLVNLWGFGPDGERKVPSIDQINAAKILVGHEKIVVDIAASEISKSMDKTYLDLSASAKGFGVDAIIDLIKASGIDNVMVEIGGEVRTLGKSLSRDWKIGIEAPDSNNLGQSFTKVIKMQNFALATSGDYRNFFESNGKKFSHTINYKTGAPVEGDLASVSVISDTCMDADAWATALMAMGHEKALAFSNENGLKAHFIYRTEKIDQNGARIYDSSSSESFKKNIQ